MPKEYTGAEREHIKRMLTRYEDSDFKEAKRGEDTVTPEFPINLSLLEEMKERVLAEVPAKKDTKEEELYTTLGSRLLKGEGASKEELKPREFVAYGESGINAPDSKLSGLPEKADISSDKTHVSMAYPMLKEVDETSPVVPVSDLVSRPDKETDELVKEDKPVIAKPAIPSFSMPAQIGSDKKAQDNIINKVKDVISKDPEGLAGEGGLLEMEQGALDRLKKSGIQDADIEEFKSAQNKAVELYQANVENVEKKELIDNLIRGLLTIGAGIYGIQKGIAVTPLEKADYKAQFDRLKDNLNAQVAQAEASFKATTMKREQERATAGAEWESASRKLELAKKLDMDKKQMIISSMMTVYKDEKEAARHAVDVGARMKIAEMEMQANMARIASQEKIHAENNKTELEKARINNAGREVIQELISKGRAVKEEANKERMTEKIYNKAVADLNILIHKGDLKKAKGVGVNALVSAGVDVDRANKIIDEETGLFNTNFGKTQKIEAISQTVRKYIDEVNSNSVLASPKTKIQSPASEGIWEFQKPDGTIIKTRPLPADQVRAFSSQFKVLKQGSIENK